MANKKTPKSRKKSKKRFFRIVFVLLVIAVVLSLAYYGFQYTKNNITSKGVAATVNDDEISISELNQKYSALPEQYKSLISEKMFLDQMINVKLLLQEAENEGITISDDEVDEQLAVTKSQFLTDEEFIAFLKENKLNEEEFKSQIKDQLAISELLNKTMYSKIEVSESEIGFFYEKNKEMINASLDKDIKAQIESLLFKEEADRVIDVYISQLRSKSEIVYGKKEQLIVNEFKDTGSRICKEEGRPIVLYFSTKKCDSCKWVEKAFNKVADKYESKGDIAAYQWELDSGDNLRTKEKENGLPLETLNLFKKYNPESTVPTFIFGCKYVRIGNSGSNSLDIEEDEFIKFIEKTIEE